MSHEALMWFAPLGFGALAISALGVVWRRLRPAAVRSLDGEEITVETLDARADLPAGMREATVHFAAFVPHFVALARRMGHRVWIARVGGAVSGFGMEERASGLPSIFAASSDVCEAIRVAMDVEDFFAEERHGNLRAVIDAAERTGTKLPAGAAYNVLGIFDVLERREGETPAYDSEVVTRIDTSHRSEASRFLAGVLRTASSTLLASALDEGDVGHVARAGDAIVGLSLATLAGDEARLHTLVIDPRHEALRRELIRAQVRAMTTLGAQRIVTEVATDRIETMEDLRREGFRTIGSMYVETAQPDTSGKREPVVRR